MLLRSSSTPVIGTLLPFSDSPNRDLDAINKNKPIKNAPFLTFFHCVHHHNQSLKPYSCNYSPVQNSSSGFRESNRESRVSGPKSIRRAQSEGNLKKLLLAHDPIDLIEFRNPETETKPGFMRYRSMLRTEPSLSIFSDEFRDPEGGSGQEALQRTVTIGETIEAVNGGGDFSFGKRKMGLIEEEEGEGEPESLDGVQNWGNGEEVIERVGTPPLCIASGLGIGASVFDPSLVDFGESSDMEEYYKKMVDQCPFHPLFLRNYAQFLQSKGDLYGAEEYYSRASLADPEDGEIWIQYANLVWVLYHDQERASSYYKLATEVAPEDSNVLAAYASFLWEIEDDGDEGAHENHFQVEQREYVNKLNISSPKKEDSSPCLNIAGEIDLPDSIAITDGSFQSGNLEDYYRKMIELNPKSPLFLRNYAKFLYESKGDLQGAEEYYSRAILADPGDGEIIAQYAKLVWEHHRDGQKTLSYFERAVEASPDNSHVLAAYASFLWENEDDGEEDQVKVPLFHGRTVTAANV